MVGRAEFEPAVSAALSIFLHWDFLLKLGVKGKISTTALFPWAAFIRILLDDPNHILMVAVPSGPNAPSPSHSLYIIDEQ